MRIQFNRLHKIFVTSLLLKLCFVNILLAQTESSSDSVKYNLPEISVYAKRLKSTESSINLHQIEAMIPEKRNEALSFLPGIIETPEGSAGKEIVVRGVSQSRINIFFNGVPIRSNTYNNIPLDGFLLSNTESIILETVAPSLIYGANSSGNVLYLKTNPLSQKSFSLGLTSYGGNNGKQGHQFNVSGFTSKLHYKLSGGYYSRNSFRLSDKFVLTPSQPSINRTNSDQKNIEVMGMITPIFSKNHLYSLFGSFNSSEYGRPASTSRPRYRRMDFWQNAFVGLNGISSFAYNIKMENIFYYTSLKDTVTRYNDSECTQIRSFSYWNDQTFGGRSIVSKELNSDNDAHLSLDIKRDMHQQDWHSKSETKSTTTIMTLGLQNRSIKNISIAPGVSYNNVKPNYSSENSNLERKNFSAFNYKLLVTYLQDKSLYDLYAGFSYTTIFPATIDIFGDALRSDDWYKIIPNPDLKEENSRNLDFGANFNFQELGLKLGISFYYNKLTDLINAISLSDSTEQSINIADARNMGFDFTMQYDIHNKIKTYLTYSYLDARNISSNRTSDHLAYLPKHRLKLLSSFVPVSYLELNLIATYMSSQYYELIGNWDSLDSYLIIDSNMNFNVLNGIGFFIKVSNLFDENYESLFGYPQPGREFLVGLKLKY